jgi:hypothetical protein
VEYFLDEYLPTTIATCCPGWYVVESRARERLRPLAEVDEAELISLKFVDVVDVVDVV